MSSAAENMRQAASDLLGVKDAIIEKGVEIPYGTPTSEYANKIREIQSGATLGADFDIQDEEEEIVGGEFYIIGDLTLTIPEGVRTIRAGSLRNKAYLLTSIVFPSTIKYIGDSAFLSPLNLRKLTIPNSVETIGNSAFAPCELLEELIIGSNVTSIGSGAFSGCKVLKKLIIPRSCTYIGRNAFYRGRDCIALTDIYYTGTQEEWEAIKGLANAGFKGTETIHYNYTGDGSEL
jgi:hypothetical protein